MANEFRKITDQNGVDHPVCDDTRVDWLSYAKTGVHNINKLPYTEGTSKSESDVTYTVNSDSSISLSGTASAYTQFILHSRTSMDYKLPKGKYKITGGINADIYLNFAKNTVTGNPSGGGTVLGEDRGNGFVLETNETIDLQIILCINSGANTTGITVKPVIQLYDDPLNEFTPPAMTNEELTKKVQGIIDAATNAADFAAFKTAIGNL